MPIQSDIRFIVTTDSDRHDQTHPTAIAAAAAGQTTLTTSFNAYSDNKWKRIFGELPRARDYT